MYNSQNTLSETMIELITLGASVGVISGFFGIGGGTVIIPILLFLGFEIKEAIGISSIQMVFSSIYGSYLNYKKGNLDLKMVSIIGVGGFIGASFSGYLAAILSSKSLEVIFLLFASFALMRMFLKIKEIPTKEGVSPILLFVVGFILGAVSMTIGVGGSIVLIPVLVSFWHVELKSAISAGLFFVVFSSLSGLISHTLNGHVNFEKGLLIGCASLGGVYLGIHLKDKVEDTLQKKLLVVFYAIIVIYLTYRIFTNE